jgi:hypothetical protein
LYPGPFIGHNVPPPDAVVIALAAAAGATTTAAGRATSPEVVLVETPEGAVPESKITGLERVELAEDHRGRCGGEGIISAANPTAAVVLVLDPSSSDVQGR